MAHHKFEINDVSMNITDNKKISLVGFVKRILFFFFINFIIFIRGELWKKFYSFLLVYLYVSLL